MKACLNRKNQVIYGELLIPAMARVLSKICIFLHHSNFPAQKLSLLRNAAKVNGILKIDLHGK